MTPRLLKRGRSVADNESKSHQGGRGVVDNLDDDLAQPGDLDVTWGCLLA